ncbi:double-stranded RNA-binding protein Staufen homolog 1-like isoform X2 [Uranotaenia lowii]|uniref:double-stranded RNA-binding protein Staufen homolog 1-like isoform X2 n=1 Tax=Uranotaenia lowii TaxID=190385 RepID=UPI002478F068|nr:double-stranded RNA-binding protein Staufen homolog 1-like isoform X2 [Uranotaenia lowii]
MANENAKTPITELQELCVALTALGSSCVGRGRSKKDSKHDAAFRLLRILQSAGNCDDESDDSHFLAVLSTDKVTELRDICVQRNFPEPSFECVRQSGPSHAPIFEYECRITTIVRRGIHKTKKGAKQAACDAMIKTLQAMPVEDDEMQIQTLDQAADQTFEEDEHLIRTYREYKNSDIKKKLGVKIVDRHRYFEELDNTKIESARRIAFDEMMDTCDKCMQIPKALGLKYSIKTEDSQLTTKDGQKLFTFELLNNEFDVFIYGLRDEFFTNVLSYLNNMLNFIF